MNYSAWIVKKFYQIYISYFRAWFGIIKRKYDKDLHSELPVKVVLTIDYTNILIEVKNYLLINYATNLLKKLWINTDVSRNLVIVIGLIL